MGRQTAAAFPVAAERIPARAWTVLPNHYHLVAVVDLAALSKAIARLHNGTATQWNREDHCQGRSVWYRFTDRAIRSKRHYFAALNYVHTNAVKHGWAVRAEDWPWTSLHDYLRDVGRETLRT